MAYQIKRSEKEIDEVMDKAADAEDSGRTQWPNMTYEQGVRQAIAWIIGDDDVNPMADG